jgi:hypothetical protein
MEKQLIESIEACRPGSDDANFPELSGAARQIERDSQARALYERVQKWDAAVVAIMEDIDVPEGLQARILDRLRTAASSTSDLLNVPNQPPLAAEPSVQLAPSREPVSRWSRRQWLAGIATIAACVLVAAFLSIWLPSAGDVPMEVIAEGWSRQLIAHWQQTEKSPREFALPGAITAAPIGWQWLAKHAAHGVAYQLQDRAGTTAVLYVARVSRAGLPLAPPSSPQSNTAGKAVGYWRSGEMVYVLVVPGDERSYRAFVSSSPVPLA